MILRYCGPVLAQAGNRNGTRLDWVWFGGYTRSPAPGTGLHRAGGSAARREPAGLAHVHAGHAAVAGTAQRRALFQVTGQRLALVAGQERTVGVDHPPPGHAPAPLRQHPPDLARARFTEVLGD